MRCLRMAQIGRTGIGGCLLIGILSFGCAALAPLPPDPRAASVAQTSHAATAALSATPLTARGEPTAIDTALRAQAIEQPPSDAPFTAMAELSADALVQQVLARNPSLTQMTAA